MSRSMSILQEADELRARRKEGDMSLPPLEEPPPGSFCPDCSADLHLIGFCGVCGWTPKVEVS